MMGRNNRHLADPLPFRFLPGCSDFSINNPDSARFSCRVFAPYLTLLKSPFQASASTCSRSMPQPAGLAAVILCAGPHWASAAVGEWSSPRTAGAGTRRKTGRPTRSPMARVFTQGINSCKGFLASGATLLLPCCGSRIASMNHEDAAASFTALLGFPQP